MARGAGFQRVAGRGLFARVAGGGDFKCRRWINIFRAGECIFRIMCIFASSFTECIMSGIPTERPDINTITENYIDVGRMIGSKGVRVPKPLVKLAERVLHVPELNRSIYGNR